MNPTKPWLLSWNELKNVNLGLVQFLSSSQKSRRPLEVLSWHQLANVDLQLNGFSKKEVRFLIKMSKLN